MGSEMRAWIKTVATVDAAAITVVAVFAGGEGSQAFRTWALAGVLSLVVSIVGAVMSMLLDPKPESGEASRFAASAGMAALGGFLLGFVLLGLYGATKLV